MKTGRQLLAELTAKVGVVEQQAEATRSELEATKVELTATKNKLDTTKAELSAAKEQLDALAAANGEPEVLP